MKHLLFLACCLACLGAHPQKNDVSLKLEESVLNKTFAAIGEISGTNPYSFLFLSGTYQWNLFNQAIHLHPGKADFVTDVKVTVGSYNYFTRVTGDVEICYEPTTNLVYVEVIRAVFPLKILFFGKERHLWDIDLSDHFETPFTFEGPLTTSTEMSFTLPDGTVRLVYAQPVNCGVKIAEKHILVTAELQFTGRTQNTETLKKK